jgi:hypothetical protein
VIENQQSRRGAAASGTAERRTGCDLVPVVVPAVSWLRRQATPEGSWGASDLDGRQFGICLKPTGLEKTLMGSDEVVAHELQSPAAAGDTPAQLANRSFGAKGLELLRG